MTMITIDAVWRRPGGPSDPVVFGASRTLLAAHVLGKTVVFDSADPYALGPAVFVAPLTEADDTPDLDVALSSGAPLYGTKLVVEPTVVDGVLQSVQVVTDTTPAEVDAVRAALPHFARACTDPEVRALIEFIAVAAGYRIVAARQAERDRQGQRYTCSACGHPETTDDPLTLTTDGMRVHRSHTTDPESGLYGLEQLGSTLTDS